MQGVVYYQPIEVGTTGMYTQLWFFNHPGNDPRITFENTATTFTALDTPVHYLLRVDDSHDAVNLPEPGMLALAAGALIFGIWKRPRQMKMAQTRERLSQ